MVKVAPALVHPTVLLGSAELDGELADVVSHSFNVVRNLGRMQNFGWPPPVVAKLDPKDLAVERQPAGLAAVAVVEAFRRINLETFRVKTGRTKFAADEGAAVGTHEAPAGVDVRRAALLALGRRVVLGTDDLSGSDLDGTWKTIKQLKTIFQALSLLGYKVVGKKLTTWKSKIVRCRCTQMKIKLTLAVLLE